MASWLRGWRSDSWSFLILVYKFQPVIIIVVGHKVAAFSNPYHPKGNSCVTYQSRNKPPLLFLNGLLIFPSGIGQRNFSHRFFWSVKLTDYLFLLLFLQFCSIITCVIVPFYLTFFITAIGFIDTEIFIMLCYLTKKLVVLYWD